MYVLDKLENMFLDGDRFAKIQIWKMLETIFTQWSWELFGPEYEGTEEQIEENKKSMECLFNFITGLLSKYAINDGHKDELFLVVCCESYLAVSGASYILHSIFSKNDRDAFYCCIYFIIFLMHSFYHSSGKHSWRLKSFHFTRFPR
jgi:hypothetical protein